MKHRSLIASCAVCFMLGTLVPLTQTRAQGPMEPKRK